MDSNIVRCKKSYCLCRLLVQEIKLKKVKWTADPQICQKGVILISKLLKYTSKFLNLLIASHEIKISIIHFKPPTCGLLTIDIDVALTYEPHMPARLLLSPARSCYLRSCCNCRCSVKTSPHATETELFKEAGGTMDVPSLPSVLLS